MGKQVILETGYKENIRDLSYCCYGRDSSVTLVTASHCLKLYIFHSFASICLLAVREVMCQILSMTSASNEYSFTLNKDSSKMTAELQKGCL
jgi:hypothetical protein